MTIKSALILGCLINSTYALEYQDPELIFNSSSTDGYNMPAKTVFTDRAPSINDQREMAITLTLLDGTYDTGIWVKSKYQEGILITSGAKESFNDVQINNQSELFFTHQTLNGIAGVYTAHGRESGGYELINHMNDEEFYPYSSFSNLFYSRSEELFFTAKNFKGDTGIFNYTQSNGIDLIDFQNQRSRSPRSFVFAPSYNDQSQVAYKVRLGSRGQLSEEQIDQIIVSHQGVKKVLAVDKDGDTHSPWLSFRNSVALSNNGSVAFIAKDKDSEKLILKKQSGEEKVLATAGVELKEFSFFSLSINDKDWIAFRGIDLKGRHALYIATDSEVKKVLTQFDVIKVPWGEALIAYGPHIPFGGNIDMNNHGDIIVNTGLATLDNTDDYGNGVVVIFAKEKL